MAVVSYVQTDQEAVALTFDDGPSRPDTADLLDVLAEEDAVATFFIRGGALDPSTVELVARAAPAGHEIANHTQSHLPMLGARGIDVVTEEILQTHRAIVDVTGVEPTLIRPPFGHCLDEIDEVASGLGYQATIHWSVIPADWLKPAAQAIVERVMKDIRPGSVVLLHDGYPPDEPDSRHQTVEAVRLLLPILRARGLALLTVSQLLDCGTWQRP